MAGRRRSTNRRKNKSNNTRKLQRVLVRSVLILAIFGSIFYMIFESVSSLGNIFFDNNPYFTLSKYKIEILHEGNLTDMHVFRKQLDDILSAVERKNKNKINLFSLDLKLVRNVLMENNPQLKEVQIIRKLPEGLEITAIDKTPVARLFNGKGPLVDRTGYIIPAVDNPDPLPLLLGIHNRKAIKTGEITLNQDINCCLRLLNHLTSAPYGPLFDLILVNSSHPDQLTLSLHKSIYTANRCTIIIPRDDLAGGLNRAAKILDKRQAHNKITSYIDATYKVNAPVK